MSNAKFAQLMYAIFLILLTCFAGCRGMFVDEIAAERALATHGFSNAELVGRADVLVSFRGCGTEAARFDYRADNAKGKRVDVSVCVGWPLKGSTIRTQ